MRGTTFTPGRDWVISLNCGSRSDGPPPSGLITAVVMPCMINAFTPARSACSNASDACDKLRFESLHDAALLEGGGDFKIRLGFDKAARTLTIADNGIGMNREETISNLGTIARSGTKEFFSRLTGDQQKDTNLIGQFGVGFYSAFIVAARVTGRTRRENDAAPHRGQ